MQAKKINTTQCAPAQPYQSLGAGIDCLLALAMAKEPIGSRPLARKLGLEPTKVNRLLGTLAALGLARKTPDRRYVVGPGVHVLAAMSLRGSRLFSAALPVLEALQSSTGMLVALGVLWRREVCYLFHSPPGVSFEATVAARDLFPAEKSAIGLALLAADAEEHFLSFYDNSEIPNLRQMLEETRLRACALAPDKVSMAVTVGSPAFAALALANPKGQKISFPQQAELQPILVRAASDIAKAL